MRALPEQFQPRALTLDLALPEQQIESVRHELSNRAAQDVDRCYGYFPGMPDVSGIGHDLPASRAFAAQLPSLTIGEHKLFFNFLRLSQVKQAGKSHFHLDSDAQTAVTGDVTTINARLVLRLLINLSVSDARYLSYADVETSGMRIEADRGYLYCRDRIPQSAIKSIALPPRIDGRVHAVLLCTNRVLHSGADDARGHFVAAYGCELADASCSVVWS